MEEKIWNVLNWIDNNINHTIVDWVFNLFDCENEDGSDSLSYRIWKATSHAYCNWVNITLAEKWNLEGF